MPLKKGKLQIVNGPSKFDLMIAVFENQLGTRFSLVGLDGENTQTFRCDVRQVGRAFGEDCWTVSLRFLVYRGDMIDAHGHYSTQTRKGELEFGEKS